MHSCGHDMPTATGLTLARWVMVNRESLCGRVRIVFQPAEEGVRGARAMVEKGLADEADRSEPPQLKMEHGASSPSYRKRFPCRIIMNAVTKRGGVAGCFHYGSKRRAGLHTSMFDPEGECTAIPALRLSVQLFLSTNGRI